MDSSAPLDLNTTPAGVPPTPLPAGWHGVFTGESLHPVTVAMFAILAPIAVIAVTLRFHAAWKTGGSGIAGIYAADWCALAALILSLAQESIIMTLGTYQRHQYDVSLAAFLLPAFYKKIYAQYVIAWPAITLSKFSILLLYLRLFHINKAMRYAVFGGLALACVAYLPNIAVSSYFCAPHAGDPWDYHVGTHCGNKGSLKWLIASATLSLVLDLYILVLPIPQVMQLKMTFRKRIGVLLVFFTASFACVCALLTLIYRVKLASAQDTLWLGAQLWVTNLVENFIAIIVSSAPGMNSWVTKVLIPSSFYSKTTSSLGSMFKTSASRTDPHGSSYASRNKENAFPMNGYAEFDSSSVNSLNHTHNTIKVKQTYSVSHDIA